MWYPTRGAKIGPSHTKNITVLCLEFPSSVFEFVPCFPFPPLPFQLSLFCNKQYFPGPRVPFPLNDDDGEHDDDDDDDDDDGDDDDDDDGDDDDEEEMMMMTMVMMMMTMMMVMTPLPEQGAAKPRPTTHY